MIKTYELRDCLAVAHQFGEAYTGGDYAEWDELFESFKPHMLASARGPEGKLFVEFKDHSLLIANPDGTITCADGDAAAKLIRDVTSGQLH